MFSFVILPSRRLRQYHPRDGDEADVGVHEESRPAPFTGLSRAAGSRPAVDGG
jgi:hypothetical protein